MAQSFPYTYYSCPCTNTSVSATELLANPSAAAAEQDDEEQDFDPRSPRANYVLYPIEHLLYCEDCHQIRCSRCAMEEVLCYYCPSCLFEVPNSMVKTDGNRCNRNCYNCPLCTSTLTVNSLEPPPQPASHLAPPQPTSSVPAGPFFLSCPYCQWTSLDIGIQFDKPSNITGQLSRLRTGGRVVPTLKERERERDRRKAKDDATFSALRSSVAESPTVLSPDAESGPLGTLEEEVPKLEIDEAFANLNAFYKYQLAQNSSSGDASGLGALHNINFGSPSSLTRIMNLYSGGAKKAQKQKPRGMGEALSRDEGFQPVDIEAEDDTIAKMKESGWEGTTATEQRLRQVPNLLPGASDGGPDTRFVDSLRPVPALLDSKRSKRCRTCRHILAKPENKVHSTRYRIKLLALNYIPRLTLRALAAPPVTNLTAAFAGLSTAPAAPNQLDYDALPPGVTVQYLLTVRNPLFDPIKITLATPGTVPGSQSRVTILCPQFEVGANTDVWDEALSGSGPAGGNRNSGIAARRGTGDGGLAPVQAEAGKVWEKGRNWTSVIVEVVPMPVDKERRETEEDGDALEIPVFCRVEYLAEPVDSVGGGLASSKGSKGGEKEEREWAFWCVLGAGRIAP